MIDLIVAKFFCRHVWMNSFKHNQRLDPRLIWLIAFTQISGDMATEHINGNGPEEPMDTSAAVTHSEHFQTLLEAGLPQKVAEKLDEIYIAGKTLWIYLHKLYAIFLLCVSVFVCVVILITFWTGEFESSSNFLWFPTKMGTAVLQNWIHIALAKRKKLCSKLPTFSHNTLAHYWVVVNKLPFHELWKKSKLISFFFFFSLSGSYQSNILLLCLNDVFYSAGYFKWFTSIYNLIKC